MTVTTVGSCSSDAARDLPPSRSVLSIRLAKLSIFLSRPFTFTSLGSVHALDAVVAGDDGTLADRTSDVGKELGMGGVSFAGLADEGEHLFLGVPV